MRAESNNNKCGNNQLRFWAAILTIPLFLAGTALFSFLWNVPMDKLMLPYSKGSPITILVKTSSNTQRSIQCEQPEHSFLFLPLEQYAQNITNAGHLDFSNYSLQKIEIRMDHVSIGLSPSLIIFNFRTKYGFCMQTSKKPNATDRAIYQWLKNKLHHTLQECYPSHSNNRGDKK